jgi:hypothetical protein
LDKEKIRNKVEIVKYKKLIFLIFLSVIITINVWCALPILYGSMYKGNYTDIAPNDVSVSETNGFLGPFVSVQTEKGDNFIDSGKKVNVFIVSGFQDGERAGLARINLIAFLLGIVLYRWSSKNYNAKP